MTLHIYLRHSPNYASYTVLSRRIFVNHEMERKWKEGVVMYVFNPLNPIVTVRSICFNNQFCISPTKCVYGLLIILRINE